MNISIDDEYRESVSAEDVQATTQPSIQIDIGALTIDMNRAEAEMLIDELTTVVRNLDCVPHTTAS